MAKSTRTRRVVVAATTAVTLVSGATMPAHASEIQRAYAEHTAACIRLFFSDKPAHNEQCLPNNSPNIPANAGSADNGAVPIVVVPVVVAPPPPPPIIVPPGTSYPQEA